jgi:hypothetical protein
MARTPKHCTERASKVRNGDLAASLTVRLTERDRDRLDREAHRRRVTSSDLARHAISTFLGGTTKPGKLLGR